MMGINSSRHPSVLEYSKKITTSFGIQIPYHLTANRTAAHSSDNHILALTNQMIERAFSDDKLAADWLLHVSNLEIPCIDSERVKMAKAGLMVLSRIGLAGIKRNDSAAQNLGHEVFEFLRNAVVLSEYRNQHATWLLGFCYYYALGTNRSVKEAVRLYGLAAEGGLAAAQYSLATCISDGFGTPRDYRQAARWYHKAAKQGDVVSQNILARWYSVGRGVKKSYVRAVKWLIRAAQQGYLDAYVSLGKCYLYGKGVARDEIKAQKLFRYAAHRDDPEAMTHLGFLLLSNADHSDRREAVNWIQKAARMGWVRAQLAVAFLHLRGVVVPWSFYDAFGWIYTIFSRNNQ
eukprot:gene33413-40421_t